VNDEGEREERVDKVWSIWLQLEELHKGGFFCQLQWLLVGVCKSHTHTHTHSHVRTSRCMLCYVCAITNTTSCTRGHRGMSDQVEGFLFFFFLLVVPEGRGPRETCALLCSTIVWRILWYNREMWVNGMYKKSDAVRHSRIDRNWTAEPLLRWAMQCIYKYALPWSELPRFLDYVHENKNNLASFERSWSQWIMDGTEPFKIFVWFIVWEPGSEYIQLWSNKLCQLRTDYPVQTDIHM
jgi:hypothetical protein